MKIKLFYLFGLLLVYSCMPQKKLVCLQGTDNGEKAFKTKPHAPLTIHPNDELLINVSSFDDVSFNYFESQRQGGALQASNELSLSAISYTVDPEGYVDFPILKKIKLVGLTLEEATDKLRKELTQYFDQPNVRIKFAFKNITVLGEVNNPGYHNYTRNSITIFEALGLAGDMTVHANRKKVYLVRKNYDETRKVVLDLTNENIIASNYFYLNPNDLIYVRPRRSVKWAEVATPITLLFSTISTALLVLNAIQ